MVTTVKAVAVTAKTVVTHDRTKAVAKGVARHAWFTLAGVGVVFGRWRDSHGSARYERMLRGAEAAGDREALFEWEARSVAERHRRHTRIMDWIAAPIALVKALALGVLSVAGLLLALGALLMFHDGDAGHLIGPILAAIAAIAWLTWFLAAYGAALLVTSTAGGVAYLWATGRARTDPPAWAAPLEMAEGRDLVPDEGAIMSALRNLNCPPLNRKFKEGWTPRWVLATGRDGKGWRTQLELPSGVTVEMINDRRTVLAHNLVRLPVEVWPTEPKRQPGVLDLWVADSGLLTGPVEPYPLLTEGVCDYFRGVPVGIDQRGDVVTGRLMASQLRHRRGDGLREDLPRAQPDRRGDARPAVRHRGLRHGLQRRLRPDRPPPVQARQGRRGRPPRRGDRRPAGAAGRGHPPREGPRRTRRGRDEGDPRTRGPRPPAAPAARGDRRVPGTVPPPHPRAGGQGTGDQGDDEGA